MRTNGILKHKISKLAETTELPWPKALPLVLLTLHSTPFGKHKLSPHTIISSKPMSIYIKVSAVPLLTYANKNRHCMSLMTYAKIYYPQVKYAFSHVSSKDPVSHSLEPGDWVFWKFHQWKTALDILLERIFPKATDP